MGGGGKFIATIYKSLGVIRRWLATFITDTLLRKQMELCSPSLVRREESWMGLLWSIVMDIAGMVHLHSV